MTAATGPGERTRQAWSRTALATVVLVGVGARLAVDRAGVAAVAVGCAVAAAGGFAVLARRRAVQLAEPVPPPLPAGVVLAVALAVVVVDVAGVVLLLT
jgi:uncharacterized membrane protein YidH (DUF202 family)